MFFVRYKAHSKKEVKEVVEYTAGVTSDVEKDSKKGFHKLILKDKSGNILLSYELPENDFFTLTLERV